jgi:subtilisin-like proprotein convertase family protein
VTITPAAGQSGTATITLRVSDGQYLVGTSFTLTVNPAPPVTRSFTNTTAISIPRKGQASPYPSTISASGLAGSVTSVTLTLRNLTHGSTRDLDILLVGPGGQRMVAMSDAGSGEANSVTLTLSDAAASALPATALVSGTYRPANYTDTSNGGDNFSSPAPGGPYGSTLSVFNGQPANGTWSLYVMDDNPRELGSLAGGWSLSVTTSTISGAAVDGSPLITAVAVDPTGTVRLTVSAEVGLRYALEASNDWVTWTQVGVQDNTSGSMEFSESPTASGARFYRVVQVP